MDMEIREARLHQGWKQALQGGDVESAVIRVKDTDYFQTEDHGLDPETVLVEISAARSSDERGHVDWEDVTVHPVMVGDEYNMTPGYFHQRPDSEDIYWVMDGDGLMLIMDRDGHAWCEEMEEGSLHKIENDYAVRLINIGDTPLRVVHCFPSEAGKDYEAIKNRPFPCHIYDDDGELSIRVDLEKHTENEEAKAPEELFQE